MGPVISIWLARNESFEAVDEFSYTLLYCIILQELKCYIEHNFVVFVVWMRVWLDWFEAELIFKRRRQTWTNSNLSKAGNDLSISAGWHEKDFYLYNERKNTLDVVQSKITLISYFNIDNISHLMIVNCWISKFCQSYKTRQ